MLKSALTLTVGNAVGGALVLGSSLLLPHFYVANQVGQYLLGLSIATFVSILLTQGKESAVISVKSNYSAKIVTHKMLMDSLRGTCFVILILGTIALLPFNISLSNLFAYLLIAITSLTYSTISTLSQFALRYKSFRLLAMRAPLQNLVIGVLQIACGLIYPSLVTLFLCEILGRIVGIVALIQNFKNSAKIITEADGNQVRTELSSTDYKNVRKFMLPSSILENLSMVIFFLLFQNSFGNVALGFLTFAIKLTLFPTTIIGGSIGRVYLSILTREFENKNPSLRKSVKKSVLLTTSSSILLFPAIGIFYPFVLKLVLPNEWHDVTHLVQYLAFYTVTKFAWDILANLFNVLKLWALYFVASILRFVFLLLPMTALVFMKLDQSLVVFISFSLVSIVQIFFICFVTKKIFDVSKHFSF